jgi:hypothetical protein
MEPEKFITALKTLFLEILGYLIPGLLFLVILKICLNESYVSTFNIYYDIANNFLVILIIAYSLGYLFQGIAIARDSFKKWLLEKSKIKRCDIFKYPEKEIKKIKNTIEYRFSLESFKENVLTHNTNDNVDFYSLRNLLMSYSPEKDDKIYLFTFRSELCNHINAGLLIIMMLGIIALILNCFDKAFILRTDLFFKLLYLLIFPLIMYFLNFTRIRFFKIANKIIFSIYIAKINKYE